MASAREVGAAFLKLGLTSFGGPIAHLGYFRHEFVTRRRWLGEREFAELVGVCQLLPGPTSSQVGFCLGLGRAGWAGALAAWAGFTLPSAAAMLAMSELAASLDGPAAMALIHGLGIAAVAVVAQAVVAMARAHLGSVPRTAIAALAAGIAMVGGGLAQLAAIAAGAALGFAFERARHAGATAQPTSRVSSRAGLIAIAAFAVLLLGLPLAAPLGDEPAITVFDACYRAGALVFGGGHVVLPLLRTAFVGPGWLDEPTFLAGYGAAQALPGPLFSFAAFVGSAARAGPGGFAGALIGLAGIFLPGFLLLVAVLPFWRRLRERTGAVAAIAGMNAAVVGVLGAALANPIVASAVRSAWDLAIVAGGLALLMRLRLQPLWAVGSCALAALLAATVGRL